MLKKPRSLVESCCPYENMVPRFTVKVEGVHFVETAVIFCRMHCVRCYVPAGGHGVRQSHRQASLESCSSQPACVVGVNHLIHRRRCNS